jgi:hypothetical protein
LDRSCGDPPAQRLDHLVVENVADPHSTAAMVRWADDDDVRPTALVNTADGTSVAASGLCGCSDAVPDACMINAGVFAVGAAAAAIADLNGNRPVSVPRMIFHSNDAIGMIPIPIVESVARSRNERQVAQLGCYR